MLSLREKVFVVEQNCPYQDADHQDQMAWHLLTYNDHKLVTYLRILEPKSDHEIWIGRVVVDAEYRGKNLGYKAMQMAIRFCREEFPECTIKISAQAHLQAYYSTLGFQPYGLPYLEDNIPHHGMKLNRAE